MNQPDPRPASQATGTNGVVATSNPIASQIGLDVLKRGGSAADAAVAASFTLGVVEPFMSGIGGGCFILMFLAATREFVAIDARGVAPAAATEDMFVRDGQVQYQDTVVGHRSVLLPGLVAGITGIHREHGRLDLAGLVEPAARIAESGYLVSPIFQAMVRNRPDTLTGLHRHTEGGRLYLPGGKLVEVGDRLANPDLAASYRLIGKDGASAFYQGAIGESIVAEMRRGGGLITADDLADYRPVRQTPVTGDYGPYSVYSIAPPSSGGILVIQCLHILERLGLAGRDRYAADTMHLLSETMKQAFADRAHFVGDPRFMPVPVEGLLSREYARQMAKRIDMQRASFPVHGDPWAYQRQSPHTTHLCVADRDANIVAITQTIGGALGSGVVPPGTGIILNHLMGDFSPMVGVSQTHGFGVYTSKANSIGPGKTPTSSNAPTIVLREGQPVLATGAAGGSHIPSAVLQILINTLNYGMGIQKAISAPRIHDQGEGLEVEKEIPEAVRTELEHRGHKVTVSAGYHHAMTCYAQGLAIDRETGVFSGAADPRDDGLALAY